MFLYHYFEGDIGAFRNLSDLSLDEAQDVLKQIKKTNNTFASHRYDGYMERRVELEALARKLFIGKGGKPIRVTPHYMVIESCDWLRSWYNNGRFIKIPIKDFDVDSLSFTYGDLFPTFSPRVNDCKEYRRKLYTYEEILKIIEKYGYPQEWNPEGQLGPERYIEVQVWSDEPISKYYDVKVSRMNIGSTLMMGFNN